MISVRGVHLALSQHPILRGIDLDIDAGEILCLLGPSGCGKTTLLRIIAGLESVDSGDVLLEGESILRVPVNRRGFGLMFQDFALFPHLNVADNVTFGLRMQHLPAAEQQQRAREVLTLVNLAGFEHRDVAQLSGGERQRVALARSLAPNPRFLMLDEPLGSLDAALRDELIVELRSIIKQLGLTALYVTHDQREAFAIADRIAVMNAGSLEQVDTPIAVYQHPASRFTADFLGLTNIIPVTDQHGISLTTALGTFRATQPADALLLHPDGIHLADPGEDLTLDVVVRERVFQGDVFRLTVQHESGVSLVFRHPAFGDDIPAPGDSIGIQIDPSAVICLAR